MAKQKNTEQNSLEKKILTSELNHKRILLEGIFTLILGLIVVVSSTNFYLHLLGQIIAGFGVIAILMSFFVSETKNSFIKEKREEVKDTKGETVIEKSDWDLFGLSLLLMGIIILLFSLIVGANYGFLEPTKLISWWPSTEISIFPFLLFLGVFFLAYFILCELIIEMYGKKPLISFSRFLNIFRTNKKL